MNSIKKYFKDNEWALVLDCINNGTSKKWIVFADEYEIRPGKSDKKRRVAANDIWRRFLRHTAKHNLDLTTVKQTVNGAGEVLFETRKALPVEQEYSTEGMEIAKVTTNPSGGQWVSYVNKKAQVEEDKTISSVVERLFEKYLDFTIKPIPTLLDLEEGNRLAVLNLYDAHLDKLPVKSTCGVESTLEENIQTFKNTVQRIIPYIKENKVEEIIFPVGNDLFHTNGMNSTTKKGTPIEYFGSPEDAYYAICDVITETILELAEIADVRVIMVKGNHDEDKITTLGYWLERSFRHTNVSVDFMRRQRKYIKYGENLIGFAHGDKEKSKIAQLPLIMAQEAKELWGTTTYRKMFLGDLHHGFEYQFLKAKDQPGVEVEYLRSVGTTDTWHEDFGWIGVPKTAYLQIFDKNEGEFSRMKFNIK